jgi:predicted GNAT family acetyltransferase
VAGAWAHTRPRPLRLGRLSPQAAGELAELLAAAPQGADVRAVAGALPAAEAFAAVWCERTGTAVGQRESLRLYRLGELTPPQVSGRLRRAEEADLELAVAWFTEFAAEVLVGISDPAEAAIRRVRAGELHLWEDGGVPVCLAGLSPVLAGMSRIGPVYTPRERRNRGYASAATAGVSAVARAWGAAEVLLYTDLSNPTSNSIYQKIGYRAVADDVVLDFVRG